MQEYGSVKTSIVAYLMQWLDLWVSQDLSVHLTLSLRIIDMWLTLYFGHFIQIDFMKEFKWITIYRGSQYPYFFHHFPFLKQWSLTTCFDKAIRTDHVWIFSFILLISIFLRFRFLFLLMHAVLQWYLGYIGLNFLWYFLVWSIATDDSEFLIMVSCHRPSFRCKVSTFYFSEAATGGVL